MELRHFEYFLAVAEERNFTRAAARLHVVQSGVSAVSKALERELGAELLERTSKRVVLTDAGEALLPRARAALDAVRAARDAVDEVRGGLRGTVRIGTLTSVEMIDVPALLGRFHRARPDVQLQLEVSARGSDGLLEGLLDGSLDVAIASVPGRAPSGVRVRQTHRGRLHLVLPDGHRLVHADRVTIADLRGEAFVDFPEGYGNRIVVDRAFAAAGVRRHVAIQVMDLASGAGFVREGLGVAFLPEFAVPDRRGLVVRPLSDSDLEWPLGLAVSALRAPSAATRAMIEMLENAMDSGETPTLE